MSTSCKDETSSICSVSEEDFDNDGSVTGSADTSKRTLGETGIGLNCGATGIGDRSSDVRTAPLLSAPVDPEKRRTLDAAVDAVLNKNELIKRVRLKFRLTFAELDQALLEKGAVDIVKVSRHNRRAGPLPVECIKPWLRDGYGTKIHSVFDLIDGTPSRP